MAVVGVGLVAGCGNEVKVDETGGGGAATTVTTGASGGAGGTSTTTGAGGVGAGGATGTTVSGCQGDDDCVGEPGGPICDPETGTCVACLPVEDAAVDCGVGAWCNVENHQCEVGCTGDADCPSEGGQVLCDVESHVCKGCLSDDDCSIGTICVSGDCAPGCTPMKGCAPGLTCCGQQCFDLASDEDNCGVCNQACVQVPGSSIACEDGHCIISGCAANLADCNGDISDGCEHNALADGPCVCEPGSSESCYLGKVGTEGVGACKAGARTCKPDGTGWGPCSGQVLPMIEVCANGADDDCDGALDEVVDEDYDGWTICDGDCNDLDGRVNPGAIEIPYILVYDGNDPFTPNKVYTGNGKDDDCNSATPDGGEPALCASVAKLTGVTAQDLASAMELCQVAVPNAPKPQKAWGLLSAELRRADGSAPEAAQLSDMMNKQVAVLAGYGVSAPKVGPTMVGLSTGMMRDLDDPGAVAPSPGTDLGWSGSPPAVYLAWNGGVLPANSACNGFCPPGVGANDDVALRLVVRVPTNAYSFRFDYRVFTAAYPAGMCNGENDFFLTQLTTWTLANSPDGNVVFDSVAKPVSVSNSFFEVCEPAGCATCPQGAGALAGTGMTAGTQWLRANASIVGGETITLDLTVFDVSTGSGDWVALMDGLEWWFAPSGVK